jgi:hypothetical protein
MARQYSHLLRAKRAGHAHEKDGLRRTSPGGLAVACWACPHDGRNLPEGWKDVDPEFRCVPVLQLLTVHAECSGFTGFYICCYSH